MKKKLLLSLAAATILNSSIAVCAAPQYMADGAIFDPEWYLEQNPDVAAVGGIDMSADAVYQHYTMHGANEGRKPFNEATLDMASILPYQGTSSAIETTQPATPAINQEQPVTVQQQQTILVRNGIELTDENTIMAIEGQSYSLNWYTYTDFRGKGRASVSFHCIPKDNMDAKSLEILAPYKLPGYEWREVQAAFVQEEKVSDLFISPSLYVDGYTNWNYTHGIQAGSIQAGSMFYQEGKFTVNLNGTDYSECMFFADRRVLDYRNNSTDDHIIDFFILVPENYSGSMSIILKGDIKNSIRFDF